jgi:hypothetical protein
MGLLSTGSTTASVNLEQYETFHDAIKLVRGDTLPQVNMTLRDSNTAATGAVLDATDSSTWAPIDLTGATIKLKLRPKGSSVVKEVLDMFIIGDPTEGSVFMGWTSTALDTAGEFTGEVEVTYGNGDIVTVFKQLRFIVREDY